MDTGKIAKEIDKILRKKDSNELETTCLFKTVFTGRDKISGAEWQKIQGVLSANKVRILEIGIGISEYFYIELEEIL